MATNLYDIGDVIRCTGTFADASNAATDPALVTVKVKAPDGTITTYTYGVDDALVRLTTGTYYVDVPATAAGQWWYRFHSTGSGQSADEHYFQVEQSQFV